MATNNVSLLLELIREKLLIFIPIKKFKNYIAALTIELKKNRIPESRFIIIKSMSERN